MKLKPIGIAGDAKNRLSYLKASDFGNERYDGIQLRKTKKGNPVVIMRCKKDSPMPWKVVYGFSQVFFKSFAEAVEFCNGRGMELVKERYE